MVNTAFFAEVLFLWVSQEQVIEPYCRESHRALKLGSDAVNVEIVAGVLVLQVSREQVEALAIGDLHKMLGSGSCGAIWMLYFETTYMAVKIPLADKEGIFFIP